MDGVSSFLKMTRRSFRELLIRPRLRGAAILLLLVMLGVVMGCAVWVSHVLLPGATLWQVKVNAAGMTRYYSPSELQYTPNIPRNILMSVKDKSLLNKFDPAKPTCLQDWQEMNPEYKIYVFNDTDMERMVVEHFPDYVDLYRALYDIVERADLWRYLAVYLYGGVYVDIDTAPIVPIDEWHIHFLRNSPATRHTAVNPVNAIVSVEFDSFGDPGSRVQFQQYVLYGVRGHPLHLKAAEVVKNNFLSEMKQGHVNKGWDAVQRTGPQALTEAVYWYVRDKHLPGRGISVVGDLGIDYTKLMEGPLLKHLEHGSWKHPHRWQKAEHLFPGRYKDWKSGKIKIPEGSTLLESSRLTDPPAAEGKGHTY